MTFHFHVGFPEGIWDLKIGYHKIPWRWPCNFLQHPPLQLSSLAEWVPLRPGKMDYRVVRKKTQLQSSWDLRGFMDLPPKVWSFDPSPCGMESGSAGSSCRTGEIPLQGERWDLSGGRAGFPPLEMALLVCILQGKECIVHQAQCQTMMVVQASIKMPTAAQLTNNWSTWL